MTTRPRALRLAVTVLLVLAAPLSVVLYRLVLGGDVPDPLPTHWGAGGEADGTSGLTSFTVASLTLTAVLAAAGVAALAFVRRNPLAVLGLLLAAWLAWVMATTYAATLTASAGADSASDVPLHAGLVAAILLVPTLVTAVIWLLVPFAPRGAAPVPTPSSPLSVRPGERVTWVGQSSSPALLLLGLALVLAAVGLVFVLWPLALALGLSAVAVAWVHRIMVRVDDTAVTVAWGPGRWPRVTLPMAEVTAAHPATIEPLSWGGWGYRVTPRGHAAVARRGPGLVLSRRDGSPFAVTVDTPEAAADVVNAVVALREAPGRPQG